MLVGPGEEVLGTGETVDIVVVELYDDAVFLKVTGSEVLDDSDDVIVISVPSVLPCLVVCEWVPYIDGVEAIEIFSVVPINEADTVNLDAGMLVVTDVLL